ncbi:ATP-binding cassette domain-containing protein [Kitasatospora sp. GAS1066B]|uniref:ATP-binding cassette domain-containing protein n=1 Tax=Kitasatospora sp. GAS1066B TaxID=3156271 RepID=UPI00351207AE
MSIHPTEAVRTDLEHAGTGERPVLSLRGAAVRVGGRTLWSGVDLTVGAAEFTAVLGPNGVGKSTLVKVLLGVLPAAAGEVRVLGGPPGALVRPVHERELPEPVTALAWAGPGLLLLADHEGRVEAWPLPRGPVR